nr:endo-1,4-beta-xylanase [Eubacterium sp.]
MRRNVKSVVAKTLAVALAFTTVVTTVPAGEAEAAKKPKLSKKKVTVEVKKSAKITIKNVKAKKVKKLTVKTSKKKVATVKKNGKTAFTITGKKAGKATITAKVKVGKKTTTLKVNVTVKKAAPAAPAESAAPSTSPAIASATPVASTVPSVAPSTEPTVAPTVAPTPLTNYTESFDTSVGDWFPRYSETDSEEAGVETKLSISSEAHSGTGALLMEGRVKPWNSPGMDMSQIVIPGATYKLTFWAKVPDGYDDWEDGINVRFSGAYKMEEDSAEKYENYPADTDYFVAYDEWSYHEVEFVAPSALYTYTIYFETNGSGKCPLLIDDVTLDRTSTPRDYDPSLPSIKDTYATVGFDTLGTAVSYDQLLNKNVLGFVKHHYNSITLGNQMKPDAVISKDIVPTTDEAVAGYIFNDTYATRAANLDAEGNPIVPVIDFTYIDKCLKLAAENGLKLRYHTFVWHQQMPRHFFAEGFDTSDNSTIVTDQATILDREEMYIRTVMNHIMNSEYADVVYTIDVVNEYTHMDNISAQVGSDNWWRYSFGEEFKTDSEYVKKAFVWAYDELVKAGREDKVSLVYNDYSTYMPGTKEKIIELVNNINKVDDINTVGKICAGVGMQAHLAEQAANAEVFRETIDAFAAEDFEIQITELDITNTGEVIGTTSAADKAEVWEANAKLYGEIMTEIIDAKANGANITSVTIWGISDATSWREDRAPVLFGSDLADVKPSFYAVIDAALNYGK